MAYVTVKGGEQAIEAAHAWLAEHRRGDPAVPELTLAQIAEQLGRAVDRAMGEGSLYDRELAALAVKQAQGDLIEAVFLLRAYRTTLPRFAYFAPVDTAAMHIRRRRHLRRVQGPARRPGARPDLRLHPPTARLRPRRPRRPAAPVRPAVRRPHQPMPRVPDILAPRGADGTRRTRAERTPGDLTREPLDLPRAAATCGFRHSPAATKVFCSPSAIPPSAATATTHPFAGEIRIGDVAVEIEPPELGFAIDIGDITLTECQMVNQFKGSKTAPRSSPAVMGWCSALPSARQWRMALVDRAHAGGGTGRGITAPAQNVEFVLYHRDNIEATGFVEHLKLPHYVDFQSELENVRATATRGHADDGRRPRS